MVLGYKSATYMIRSSANAIECVSLLSFRSNWLIIVLANMLKSKGELTVPCCKPSVMLNVSVEVSEGLFHILLWWLLGIAGGVLRTDFYRYLGLSPDGFFFLILASKLSLISTINNKKILQTHSIISRGCNNIH